jgi:AraC family transcriptional regulator of adaptative response/methylated-DNA-[protein]-cysteine methyltransferase
MNAMPGAGQFNYGALAAALRYIDGRRGRRPSLDEIADAAGLSTGEFQRAFAQWAGVNGAHCLDHLLPGRARRLLAGRCAAERSGPELRWEAMPPAEYIRKGKGLTVSWGWFDSPFGEVLAMGTERGLCGMAFAAELGRDRTLADMRGRWPAAVFQHRPDVLAAWTAAAFAAAPDRGEGRPISLQLIGAPFQVEVWAALLAVPAGYVTTYSEIARRIGNPKAVRAVGTAVGRNPVSWLVPCHRALRRDGELGGYHWGLPIKRAMLAYESARVEP